MKNRMYKNVKTWNPFKGCLFDCVYCKPSFQQQAKRQKHNCQKCYDYMPHEHPERLRRIPNAETVFVCGNGDISFSSKPYTEKIIAAVKDHSSKHPGVTYYFQSKWPSYFEPFVDMFPESVIILTTLETNRDDGYRNVSMAPLPSDRYRQFLRLKYPRKVVTIEPILDFDVDLFLSWLVDLKPEYVWLGFNSRPKQVILPEPSEAKVLLFAAELISHGIRVIGKELRGVRLD